MKSTDLLSRLIFNQIFQSVSCWVLSLPLSCLLPPLSLPYPNHIPFHFRRRMQLIKSAKRDKQLIKKLKLKASGKTWQKMEKQSTGEGGHRNHLIDRPANKCDREREREGRKQMLSSCSLRLYGCYFSRPRKFVCSVCVWP